MSTSVLDRFRQPEYTGPNRCIPCTAANVIIATALSLAVRYTWAVVVGPFAWAVGGILFAAGLTATWLRGYFVPGTPEFTKRYFPNWLLSLFDKTSHLANTPGGIKTAAVEGDEGTTAESAEADATDDEPTSPKDVDPEAFLLSAGIVEPCDQEDDLCLDEGFRVEWHERMRTIRDEAAERDELARELELDSEAIEFEEHGDAFVAHTNDEPLGQWESRAALVADLAAAREFPEWLNGDDWDALPPETRSQVVRGLRIFLNTCPICEGPVASDIETVESCCRSHDIVAASCDTCDARLLEMRYPEPA